MKQDGFKIVSEMISVYEKGIQKILRQGHAINKAHLKGGKNAEKILRNLKTSTAQAAYKAGEKTGMLKGIGTRKAYIKSGKRAAKLGV